jgi:hypothetical protein
MPKATRPAEDADMQGPAVDESAVADETTQILELSTPEAAPAPQEPDEAPEWGNWQFTDHGPLTYSAIPVTVTQGDVIFHPGIPADDGRWVATDLPVSRFPDNHRPETAAATSEEG